VRVKGPEFKQLHASFFDAAESAFIVFFSVEYVVKLAVSQDKWVFFRRYFIDLLAILPFLRFFRLFRGLRILRLLRVVRLLRLGNMVARRLSMLEGAGLNNVYYGERTDEEMCFFFGLVAEAE